MKFYSDFPAQRARQFVSDLFAIAAMTVAIIAGVTVHASILGFAALGQGLESAGSDFESTMADAADAVGNVPLVGDGVRAPFDKASDAGAALASAGADQQVLVGQGALVLGVVVALIPILIVLRVWMVRRIRFVRRAAETRTLASTPSGRDLLALRAITTATPNDVLSLHPDPAGAWRRGDSAVVEALSRLELTASGVRLT